MSPGLVLVSRESSRSRWCFVVFETVLAALFAPLSFYACGLFFLYLHRQQHTCLTSCLLCDQAPCSGPD